MRLSMNTAMSIAASILNSSLDSYAQQQQLSQINYYSRGKGGRKSPRTFSGIARARREAKRLRASK